MVAADPTGGPWCWGEASDAGEPVDGLESSKVTASVREERGAQYGAEARHAEQDRRIGMLLEALADLLVELGDRLVDDGDLMRELGDELRAHPRFFKQAVNSAPPIRRIEAGV